MKQAAVHPQRRRTAAVHDDPQPPAAPLLALQSGEAAGVGGTHSRRPLAWTYYVTKRLIDATVAAVLLTVLLPVLAGVALAIKLDSPGPVIFAQQRLRSRRITAPGASHWVVEPFTLYKFRTMTAGSDSSLHRAYMSAYLTGDEERLSSLRPGRRPGESYRPAHDPRVTGVGTVLRSLSLDELPQLWNVLRGDMTLVGPRPPLDYEVELYDEHHVGRLRTPVGMTGWAQVRGRCAVSFGEMVGLDLEYIRRQSTWFDLAILLRTVPVVLSRKGAD